jgi:hypothetical protein
MAQSRRSPAEEQAGARSNRSPCLFCCMLVEDDMACVSSLNALSTCADTTCRHSLHQYIYNTTSAMLVTTPLFGLRQASHVDTPVRELAKKQPPSPMDRQQQPSHPRRVPPTNKHANAAHYRMLTLRLPLTADSTAARSCSSVNCCRWKPVTSSSMSWIDPSHASLIKTPSAMAFSSC